MNLYDKAINQVKDDPAKLEVVLRSHWLHLHRGINESTVNNPTFNNWLEWRMKYVPKR